MLSAKPLSCRRVLAWTMLVGGWAALATPGETAKRPTGELVLLANRDDDDRDGLPDADDDRLNGAADERDLTPIEIALPADASSVQLSAGTAPVRFFIRRGSGWHHLGRGAAEVPVEPGSKTLRVDAEALAWAGTPAASSSEPAGWSGAGTIRVVVQGKSPLPPLEIPVRVAPVRLLPATAPVRKVFVAKGRYDNEAFVTALRGLVAGRDATLVDHPSRDWREMWMQDTMEIGVAARADAATPGSTMHVVLAGLRGADSFPPTLLGPDVAVAEVASPRPMAAGDAWADWYGNLEVSIPTAEHPSGRVIHGRNRLTGASFHPDVVAFLAAQGVQSPVWIDTSWLLIKHVDEIVSFLPGADGRGVILVPDPEEGMRLLAPAAAGDDAVAIRRQAANARIAREIEALLEGSPAAARSGEAAADHGDEHQGSGGLLALLGLGRDRVVRLPVAFDVPAAGLLGDGGVTDASSLWSNPVNALVVNGSVICGSAGMPDAVRDACRERFLAAGASHVAFIDDGCYHRHHGNVHCATNALRDDASTGAREAEAATGTRPGGR